MAENPHTYDDAAYLEASANLHSSLLSHIQNLWLAGATVEDIRDLVEEGVDEALAGL